MMLVQELDVTIKRLVLRPKKLTWQIFSILEIGKKLKMFQTNPGFAKSQLFQFPQIE